jgi:integrase
MSVRKRRWITSKGEARETWIVDYVDQAGDRHIETFERKKEADEHWATVKVEVRKGVYIAPSKSPTVAAAADKWLREVEARNVERSTRERYKQHVNLHIVPLIGRTKLTALNPDRVEAFRDELLAKLSRPLARKVLTSFKSMLKVSRYSHVGVGISIERSRKEKRRLEPGRDFPKPAEITRLLAAAKDDTKGRALLLILAFTGLRASEIRGLRWSDIELNTCKLHVRQRVDEYNVIGVPKSDSSVRTIPLDPDVMVPALREWKLKSPPSDFVFSTRTGKPQDYNGLVRGTLDPVMRAAHLVVGKDQEPKYTPHAFRHFFASWCINSKADGGRELPPKQVQYLLGHSTISMTFDIYGHMFPSEGNRDELTAAVRQLLA